MSLDATVVGTLGVGLLLAAFFANLFGQLARDGYLYPALNLVGGVLAAVASWWIDYLPFVVLEATWAAVAAVALVRRARLGARRVDRGR